jgi:alkylated DNA repair dioxygenase AlkB
MRVALSADAWVDLEPAFLSAAEADALFVRLPSEATWEQREIVLYGKRIMQPRLIAWGGAPAYRYSGQTLEPRPLTPTVAMLLRRVSAFAGVEFNHVLANRYRNGADSMGLHADDEPELGPAPVIATLSFGATRKLVVIPRRSGVGQRHSFALGNGSLLIMGGRCQEQFRHGVPRDATVAAERISLTLRAVTAAAP